MLNLDDFEAMEHLLLLTRHHHVMAAVKLLADWLTMNEGVAAACAKSSSALWSRLVRLLDFLPTERAMIKNGKFEPVDFMLYYTALKLLIKNLCSNL